MKVGKQDQQITLRVCSKHSNEKVVDFLTLIYHMGTCKQLEETPFIVMPVQNECGISVLFTLSKWTKP